MVICGGIITGTCILFSHTQGVGAGGVGQIPLPVMGAQQHISQIKQEVRIHLRQECRIILSWKQVSIHGSDLPVARKAGSGGE